MASQKITDNFVAPPCVDTVKILFEDDDILLINKPSGLLSLSGKNPLNWDSVHHRLVNGQEGETMAYHRAKLPHRLDLGTSGIMLVGLHARVTTFLNKEFQSKNVRKEYTAMLEGWLKDDVGHISAPIAKCSRHFPRVIICKKKGKESLTEYRVIKRLENPCRSLVSFTPLTGRTHQLRIHSQYIGHPILGCDLYHSGKSAGMADRLLLHASSMHFTHPTTDELVHGVSNCPFSE